MRMIIVAGALLLLAGCAQKTPATGSTQEKTDTAIDALKKDAKDAGAVVTEESKELGDEVNRRANEIHQTDAAKHLAAGAKEIGVAIKEGSGEAAEKAGEELKKAGQKMKKDAKASPTGTQ